MSRTPSRRKRWKRRAETWLARTLGPPLLRLLARTWRVERIGLEHREDATRDGARPVFSLWHEHILAAVGAHQHYGIRVMVSHHHDGEVISRIVGRLGFRAVRGSSSRGGSAALRAMIRAARDPDGFALTPDGPRGPAHVVAPGVLYLAAAVQRPLVATAFAVDRAWRARSWDRMLLPKPFARVVVSYGAPLDLPRDVMRSETQLAAEASRLERAMAEAQAAADRALGGGAAGEHAAGRAAGEEPR